jgi:lipopolysaccharide heptosyltransferase II
VKSPQKILIFRQSSLGDVILTLPILDRLREAMPDCRIDYLTKTPYAQIPASHSAVSNVFAFDKEHSYKAIVSGLKGNEYDIIIDLQGNMRSIALRIMIPSARFLRYRKRRLAREMVVRRAHRKLSVDHTVMAYQAALTSLHIEPKLLPPVMTLSPEDRGFADDFLASLSGIQRLIAFCPGARHFEKRWPAEEYRRVAESLLEDPSTAIIVFSADNDEFAPDLDFNHDLLLSARGLGLLRVAALLSRCRLALTNDSGLMHLANAVGTPVLAIFGPTNPRLGFAPTLTGSRVICDDVPCSPCSVHGERPCYQPRKFCFEKITPQRVLAEINSLLSTNS